MTHLRSLTTAMAVLLLATPLVAQSSPGASPARDTSQLAASAAFVSATSPTVVLQTPSFSKAPSWTNAVSIAPDTTARRPFVRAAESGANSQNTAMMIVGGVGVLGGALIGGKAGTVVMIGGTAVGLIGLWRYLM